MKGIADRSLVRWSAYAIFILLVLIAIFPVLSAPLEADDRYWYLTVPGSAGGSYFSVAESTISEIPSTLDAGRIAPLAFLARRFLALATTQAAMAFTVPIAVIHGLAKALLIALAFCAIWTFLRSLRWRDDDGRGRALRSITIRWLMVAIVALTVVGAQTQAPFRNAWISYPVLTYSAVTVIFGTFALGLTTARKVFEKSRSGVLMLVSLGLLGVALNFTYELYFVVVPLLPVVLWMAPLGNDRRVEKKARLLTGGVFLMSFVSVFVVVRALVSTYCSGTTCYSGTDPSLGWSTFSAWGANFATALPLFGRDEFVVQASEIGLTSAWDGPLSSALRVIGPLLALVVGALLIRLASSSYKAAPADLRRRESRMLMRASLVALAVALGTALIMALSSQAQELITGLGQPYRNTMVTWTALAIAVVLAGGSVVVRSERRTVRVVPTILIGVLIAILGFVSIPFNTEAVRAHRLHPAVQVVEKIHWEVVLGDPSPEGDRRRCELYAVAEDTIFTQWIQTSMKRGAQRTALYFHDLPYCSEWPNDV